MNMKAALFSLLLTFAGTLNGMAAIDAYMRIVGETGFSETGTPANLSSLGFFPLGSVSIGVKNTVSIGTTSGGAGAGKATFKELTISKAPGKVSTDIFRKLVRGDHYQEVEIILVRSGVNTGGQIPYVMTFGLKLVMAQDLDYSVSDGDDVPEEKIVLQYGAIRVRYYKQDVAGVTTLDSEEVWSRVLNTATYSAQ